MPRDFRKRVPGSEPVPVYGLPQTPPIFECSLTYEGPDKFNGFFINSEFGQVVFAHADTATLTHS
jgi:hypothetical protein